MFSKCPYDGRLPLQSAQAFESMFECVHSWLYSEGKLKMIHKDNNFDYMLSFGGYNWKKKVSDSRVVFEDLCFGGLYFALLILDLVIDFMEFVVDGKEGLLRDF